MNPFTEKDVLDELDKAYLCSNYFTFSYQDQSNYEFFINLELPYTYVAGSRILLYADSTYWAIISEINGYNTQQGYPEIQFVYLGNGIDYEGNKDELCNSNWSSKVIMDFDEIESITNKNGSKMEQYQLIAKDIDSVKINDHVFHLKNDYEEFKKKGIAIRDYENSENLISFENLIRYISETKPEILYFNENRIKRFFIKDIPLIMTIDKFHYTSDPRGKVLPSQQELFQLIAKILVTKDTSLWKPTLPPNNHWSNWESGNM